MNQNWGMDNLFLFNDQGGTWELYTYKVGDYFVKDVSQNNSHLFIQAKIERHVRTKEYPCKEENNVDMTSCYNNFYMMKLNCSFPWITYKTNDYTKCGVQHKISELVNLINEVNLGTQEIMEEINAFGCNEQNCQQTNWEMSSFQKVKLEFNNGRSYFKLTFPSSKKISVMEESLAYTKFDLLADIGGYAGIFVGASIITVYDIALTFVSNAWKVIKQMGNKV